MFHDLRAWGVRWLVVGALLIGCGGTSLAGPPLAGQHITGGSIAPPAPPNLAPGQNPTSPPVELIQERYPDRKIHRTRHVTLDSARNYVNHGPFTEYSPSGRKAAAGNFEMGRRQGTWYRWYESNDGTGALFGTPTHKLFQQPFVSEVQLLDDKLHGVWTVYDALKAKVSVWNFAHGKREGKSTWFYPDGHRAREIDYHDGLIHGKAVTWNNNDQITEDLTYIQGRRLAVTTYWHGKEVKAAEGQTLFAPEKIESSCDWWNASITYSDSSDAVVNEKTGVWIWWHPNGQKACEGRFEANQPEGPWVFWHQNGQKQMEGIYQDGSRIGVWEVWTDDGSFVREESPDDLKTVFKAEKIPADSEEDVASPIDDDHGDAAWRIENGRLRGPKLH